LLAGRGQNRVSRQGIRRILNKLHVLLKHDPGKLKEKVIQLEMLGKLLKVQNLIIEEERNMPIHYNLKTDIRYMQGKEAGKNSGFRQGVRKGIKQGLEKGLKEAERHSIRKLLLKTTLDPKKIAEVLEVSVNKVLAVKRELN
jgi:flagellar biosynthesis/type III secretory pathway protein FliH